MSSNSTKGGDEGAVAWSVVSDKVLSASMKHVSIAFSNMLSTSTIEEESYDAKVAQPICDMRKDTQLVVVDLPGITDVTSEEDVCVKYLNAMWDSYDCVVVVLDVIETTDKQVDLLKLVHGNLKEKKDIPVIFVCNKVDNPWTADLVTKEKTIKSHVRFYFPENGFVSMCASDAYVYRATSGVSFKLFQELDMEWIDRICIDELGRSKWRQLSQEQKYGTAFKVVSDEAVYSNNLAVTNFPKFLAVLNEAIGGSKSQLDLIQKQLSVALKAVKTFDDTTVASISKIKCICERLGIATVLTFNDHFWTTYKNYMENAIETYKLNTDHKVFHVAMS